MRFLLTALFGLAACGGATTSRDAQVTSFDAGTRDANAIDAGCDCGPGNVCILYMYGLAGTSVWGCLALATPLPAACASSPTCACVAAAEGDADLGADALCTPQFADSAYCSDSYGGLTCLGD